MRRNRNTKTTQDTEFPVPADLPPLEGMDNQLDGEAGNQRRTWLWTLAAALIVVSLIVLTLGLGVKGFLDGLKDRGLENQQLAQEHYELGLAHLEDNEYELAIAEFELALRHDSNLNDARNHLHEAKELARAQVTPTSETRQDAARLLYEEAVVHYEAGSLEQSVAVLDELRGLDPDHQTENVKTMLTKAHFQLGLNAVAENHLDQAIHHFEAVLTVDPDHKGAQDQLNLAHLYSAALNYWERDWSATIQALKGLYALAPDYRDVEVRLSDAHIFQAEEHAEKGDWCRAAGEYAEAVVILPLELTVDKRDDAEIQCQATAEAPPPTATARVTSTPRATAQAAQSTPVPTRATTDTTSASAPVAKGRIAFTGFDAARQRYDVYVMNLAQGDASLLWPNASQPAFARGGKRLAFRNLDPLHLGLAILDLRTNTITELTAHAEDSSPSWSPETDQLVFASDKHGDRKWRLYVISPSEVRGDGEEWVFGQMPDWSRDGTRIAYHGCDERGDNCSVWVMQPGGFNPARLTTDPSDTAPAWSPDGTQVVFISARTGNWELFLVEIATGQEIRLTENDAVDIAPVWSPDGKQIAFLSNRDGVWAVYILEVKSGQVHRIIATGDAYPDPFHSQLSWIP
jgi:tetratricopeptide (TPR) repeat protein